jgi:GYF domain 2
MTFFAAINGQQVGPFDVATLTAKVRDGSLTRQTLVWRQGMTGWAAADSQPELQAIFAHLPPPLPP